MMNTQTLFKAQFMVCVFNLPSGYLESRQAAYDLLLESDLFNEDEDN